MVQQLFQMSFFGLKLLCCFRCSFNSILIFYYSLFSIPYSIGSMQHSVFNMSIFSIRYSASNPFLSLLGLGTRGSTLIILLLVPNPNFHIWKISLEIYSNGNQQNSVWSLSQLLTLYIFDICILDGSISFWNVNFFLLKVS